MAFLNIGRVRAKVFTSNCNAVTPFSVPVTLKSMSPLKSSIAARSDSTAVFLPSMISPIAIPETGALIGTPASISAKVDAHVDAIEVEPLELVTSETSLIAYGKSEIPGSTGSSAFSANAPCPISRLPGEPTRPVSPVE